MWSSVDAPAVISGTAGVTEMVLTWSSGAIENRVGCMYVVDSAAVVSLRGELDLATTPDLQELLDRAGAAPASSILVDLSGVSFIDAHTIGVIICAWTAAQRSGQQLRVDGLANQPARVFDILELRGWLAPHGPEVSTAGRTV
jgi:anti-sigma B factor antagonist